MNRQILCALIFGLVTVYGQFDLAGLIGLITVYGQCDLTGLKDQLPNLKQYFTYDPNDVSLDPYQETQQYGYPAEKHIVTTQDGYILTLLRIPYGKSGTVSHKKRPIVLLIPGILGTAAIFTDNVATSNHALAYSLADAGYDVWILNPRGTTFSRKHMIYNPLTDEEYWNFGWHQIAIFDIPTSIDYILQITNEKQLNVMGYSQGTTTLVAMFSDKPAYNEKVKVFFALAPVVFQEFVNKDSLIASQILIKAISDFLKRKNFIVLPHNRAMSEPIMKACNYETNIVNLAACQTILEKMLGHPQTNIDPRALYHIVSHFPAGASIQQTEHYIQLQKYGGFRKYDYGEMKNKQIYGQIFPPSYNLENIKIPVYLAYGDADKNADSMDVLKLNKHLSNSHLMRVDDILWTHSDFVYAKNAYKLLYKDIIKILNSYNQCY